MRENDPSLFKNVLPYPPIDGHKYSRGHVLVAGGEATQTGAARLAAEAALRIGSGLVTIASPTNALEVYASHLTAVMLQEANDASSLCNVIEDGRFNVLVAGPALGTDSNAREKVLALLEQRQVLVLDADALTILSSEPHFPQLIENRENPVVFTPHEGEFHRLFPGVDLADRSSAALIAAESSGAYLVLKGPETIIAAPDGRIVINRHATPWLATAGSGDVLAGLIGGLIAQGDQVFERICAAVWIHGDAGRRFGPGLISEDLPVMVPAVLQALMPGPTDQD